MRPPAQKAWSELGWQIVGAVVAVGLIVAVGSWAVWLTRDEIQQGKKLEGVEKVGPCRAAGIENAECQKQARLIFAACYVQRNKCRERYGLELVRVSRPNRADAAAPSGGDALQPNSGRQPSGPRGGGQEKQGGTIGGGKGQKKSSPPGRAPSTPPPPVEPPSDTGPGRGNGSPPGSTPGKDVVPSTVEAAGGAVEDAGDAAQGVVEGAGEAVGCALRGSC